MCAWTAAASRPPSAVQRRWRRGGDRRGGGPRRRGAGRGGLRPDGDRSSRVRLPSRPCRVEPTASSGPWLPPLSNLSAECRAVNLPPHFFLSGGTDLAPENSVASEFASFFMRAFFPGTGLLQTRGHYEHCDGWSAICG